MKSVVRGMLVFAGLFALVLTGSARPTLARAAPPHPSAVPLTPPQLGINDVTLDEGNSGTTSFSFTVSLPGPAASDVTFDIATADGSATTANSDYTAKSLTNQKIPIGQSTYTFQVLVNGDTTSEPDETFFVNITNVNGTFVGDGQGQGTILNDDAAFCPAGKYNNGSGCVNADPGHFVAAAGATAQSPCAPGYFQPNSGAIFCTRADAGFYAAGPAATEQLACPSGTTSIAGAAACTIQSGPNFVVNVNGDTDDGSCDLLGQGTGNKDCTLREAINAANAHAGADTITFSISNATITQSSALPHITEQVTIDGSGQNVTVSGATLYPVLFTESSAPLTLTALTIADGNTSFHGGGVYASGALTMTNVLVQNSQSAQTGGGVVAVGAAHIAGSTIYSNTAASGGGAVFGSTAGVTSSNFTHNRTGSSGNAGGAYFTGAATLNNVTFDTNLAGTLGGGGAVFHDTSNLTGGAFTNNTASFAGGGAYFEGAATIDGTRFFSNTVLANRGGGAYFNGTAVVQNALFNGNSAQADRGGGAYFRSGATVTATDFITNTASNRAGGAYFNSTVALTSTDFYTNSATARAGGVYLGGAATMDGGVVQGNHCNGACWGGGAFVVSTLVLTNTQFIDNQTDTDGDGGGAYTSANTTMVAPTFRGNKSTGSGTGGGLSHNGGTLSLSGGVFAGNEAGTYGGGLRANGLILNITSSTFAGNKAGAFGLEGGGGGIIVGAAGTLNVANSTFSGNQVLNPQWGGGGIFNFGTATVTNSTLNNNTSPSTGGGIGNYGTLTVINSTVAGNTAANGGGIANTPSAPSPATTLENTIVANSVNSGDCFIPVGTLTADSLNIDSDGSCDSATTRTTAQINLGALASNGGPTLTMALLPGSAAIDKAPNASCTAAPVNGLDQRGEPRNVDGDGVASTDECDIGAFELQAALPVAAAGGPYSGSEGSPILLDGSGSTPAATITHYLWDCTDDGTFDSGAAATANCTYPDNGAYTALLQVVDSMGQTNDDTAAVTVGNVPPTATFVKPASVNEGSAIVLKLTSPKDPSSADTAAGFKYAFNCGNGSGFNAFASANSRSCATTDNGVRSVNGKIRDKDLGATPYTGTVTVNNVPPSATFSAPASVNEGSAFALALNNRTDPSTADTTAGFKQGFDCGDGAGFSAWGTSTSRNCAAAADGPATRTAKGRIRDKDLGANSYSAGLAVKNVAPSAQFGIVVMTGTNKFTLKLANPTDPSAADTTAGFTYGFDCGNGTGFNAYSATTSRTCTGVVGTTYSVQGRIKDKDGGVRTYSTRLTLTLSAAGGIEPRVDAMSIVEVESQVQ